jgi:hypothetical protein
VNVEEQYLFALFDTAIVAEQRGMSMFASAIMYIVGKTQAEKLAAKTPKSAKAHFFACAPAQWKLDVPSDALPLLTAKSVRNEAGYPSANAKAVCELMLAFGRPYI